MKGKGLILLVASLLLTSVGATGVIAGKSNSNSVEGVANIMTKPAIVVEAPFLDSHIDLNERDSGAMAVSEDKQKLIYSLQVENGDEYIDSSFDIRNNSTDLLVAAITVKPEPVIEGVEISFTGARVGRIAPNKWLVGPIVANGTQKVWVQIDVNHLAEPGEMRTFEIEVTPTEFKYLARVNPENINE